MTQYPNDNRNTIKDAVNYQIRTGLSSINNSLQQNLNRIQSEINSVPAKYKQLRNQLNLSNEQNKRRMEEHIANTGNHTASGYAMSKRFNNQNEFNKEMNNLNISEQNQLAELKNKQREAYLNADSERNKLLSDSAAKGLELYLSESSRLDNLNETKRLNDVNIAKINSQIKINGAKDKREQEVHDVELKYLGDSLKADLALTNSKILTEASRKAQLDAQTQKTKSSYSSGGSGSGGSSSLSKMSPAQLAENINKQTGTLKYDSNGKGTYIVNPFKAYTLLMEWKKKFGLSTQVVNDTAIHLGIQSYL